MRTPNSFVSLSFPPLYRRFLMCDFFFSLAKLIFCAINQIPPISQPATGQGDPRKWSQWRKDVLWCDFSSCLVAASSPGTSLLPKVFFHVLFAWDCRLFSRVEHLKEAQVSQITFPFFSKIVRSSFAIRGKPEGPADMSSSELLSSGVRWWLPRMFPDLVPRQFPGAGGAVPGFLNAPFPLTPCQAFPWLGLQSQSQQGLGLGPHVNQAAFRAFQKQNPLLLAWLSTGMFPDKVACARHVCFFSPSKYSQLVC